MCGESDSPVEYFTPHRTAAAASNELTISTIGQAYQPFVYELTH